ncbi:hypothetical protein, partial [Denitrobacterium detoxificans]
AVVTRVDADGTTWCQVDGSTTPTPCATDMACSVGDVVTVRIADHRATVTGNATSPATDDSTALVAQSTADVAQGTAKAAGSDASAARRAASAAARQASAANAAASEASALASATNQHFWQDSDGASVTEQTQDEYAQQPTGWRKLLKSTGEMLTHAVDGVERIFRSDTASGTLFFDGECAPDSDDLDNHIVASFTAGGAQIGAPGGSVVNISRQAMTLVNELGDRSMFVGNTNSDSWVTGTNTYAPNDSAGTVARLDPDTGTASTYVLFDLDYPDGAILHFDENDRVSPLTVEVDGVELSSGRYFTGFSMSDIFSGAYQVAIEDSAIEASSQIVLTFEYATNVSNFLIFGLDSTASGDFSVATGYHTVATGMYSSAEGYYSEATADGAHAEGGFTERSGTFDMGSDGGKASGKGSHAEGGGTRASGKFSHAEGIACDATADCAHAEGGVTKASGAGSHSEGMSTEATGAYAHAEGNSTDATANGAHAEGWNTKAASSYQHVQGKYNIEDTNGVYADIIGNGTSGSARSNCHATKWDGTQEVCGETDLPIFKYSSLPAESSLPLKPCIVVLTSGAVYLAS